MQEVEEVNKQRLYLSIMTENLLSVSSLLKING